MELERYRAPSLPKTPAIESEKTRPQIVQTERGEQTKVAEKDAFLGERTQRVNRQTVSFDKSNAVPQVKAQAQAQEEVKKFESDLRKKGLATLGVPILPAPQKPVDAHPDSGADSRWAQEGASPREYVKGLSTSDRTALNTKEYVFYGYFQRIRQRLDQAWVPILRTRLEHFYRAGRQLASDMDHTTRVLVVLNPRGEIVRVSVVSESGTHDLDAAAISAFNQAGPFPNPPKGIVNQDGEIQIPWEFILRT